MEAAGSGRMSGGRVVLLILASGRGVGAVPFEVGTALAAGIAATSSLLLAISASISSDEIHIRFVFLTECCRER